MTHLTLCETDEAEAPDFLALLEASMTLRIPRGYHEQADGMLVCPHRDLSVCPACEASSPAIVEVMGVHYWIPSAAERAEFAAMRAEARS